MLPRHERLEDSFALNIRARNRRQGSQRPLVQGAPGGPGNGLPGQIRHNKREQAAGEKTMPIHVVESKSNPFAMVNVSLHRIYAKDLYFS